jgi:hypothetical protein
VLGNRGGNTVTDNKNTDSAKAEIVKCSPASLVGKDELGLGSSLDLFRPPATDQVAATLLEATKFNSPDKVEDGFVRITPDDFVVAVQFSAMKSEPAVLVWVAEVGEPQEWETPDGRTVTFRDKEVTAYAPVGFGQGGLESVLELVAEIREGVKVATLRAIDGFGADFTGDGEGLEDEDETAESFVEALMQPGEG